MNSLKVIKSPILQHRFKMFRVQVNKHDDVEETKDRIMEKLSTYLEQNDGRLINVKTFPQSCTIIVYFVTGCESDDSLWFEYLQKELLSKFSVLP